ncbi:Putative F-box-like domain superfamily protein [Septoria linicola]|uniref:F-box-like domain superfamily protein n=1 Tax=Septoria linicola TaxID=215465 RepID=A0A9Q9AX14_9PEZI|nr:Putative F-box-like domain superfamily protein [Septoria linicola]
MSLSSAAQRTFNVAELLEMILLELPPRDVLLAQRVNKQWQGAITASLKLQQLLFFKPVSAQVLVYEDDQGLSDFDGWWEDRVTKEVVPAVQNPMLRTLFYNLTDDVLGCCALLLVTWSRRQGRDGGGGGDMGFE